MGINESHCTITTCIDGISQNKIFQCKYNMILKNFRDTKLTLGKCLTSGRLKIDINETKDEWEIVVYPNGYNERTADFLSIWLRRITATERLVQFTCEISSTEKSVIKEDKVIVFAKKTLKKLLSLESILGWSAFCEKSRILAEDSRVLEDGNLTLKFTLRIFDDKCIPHPAVEDEDPNMDATVQELSKDLNHLLQTKKYCDAIIEVNGEPLYAHKAILYARSAVFQAMLKFESEGNATKIAIDDISKDTLLVMLQFIYTGKLTKLDFDATLELYYAADKYELMSLKRLCSKIVANSLKNSNAIQVVVLANRHNDTLLQNITINFIARNANVIQKQSDWLQLMESNPTLANEVVQKLI